MALNLWKVGGNPTSYNPLPTGGVNKVATTIGNYTFRFRAKSATNAQLSIYSEGAVSVSIAIPLTPNFNSFEYSFFNPTINTYLWDSQSHGDIIIDSIELVQKPLDKLTLNGVDGFASGKWSLHANAVVVDDETLVLNANAIWQSSYLAMKVLPNTQYVFSHNNISNGWLFINEYASSDGSGTALSTVVGDTQNNVSVFKTGNSANSIKIGLSNGSNGIGTFTFKRPMLNLSSSPIPYEKKRGERMVLPTPKKNLFDGVLELGTFDGITGAKQAQTTNIRSANKIPVKPNLNIYLSNNKGYQFNYYWYDINGNFINSNFGSVENNNMVVVPSNACFMTFRTSGGRNENDLSALFQIEYGTTATPYQPYAVQVNKKPQRALAKAKTGLSFNGTTDYLQLPSMTMDSIEIECLIKSPSSPNYILFQTQDNISFLRLDATYDGSGINVVTVNGSPINTTNLFNGRVKVNAKFNSKTVWINIMATSGGIKNVNAILYKVTCYLNNAIVAQYDFENPRSIVGGQVLQNANNLIPSFEDSRWNIHANAKVLGKDVLHLDATTSWNGSKIILPVVNGGAYRLISPPTVTEATVAVFKGNDTTIVVAENSYAVGYFTKDFTVDSSYNGFVTVMLENRAISGSFDFIRPQLYALNGKEGTINGTPTQGIKSSKRQLYSKR